MPQYDDLGVVEVGLQRALAGEVGEHEALGRGRVCPQVEPPARAHAQ